MAVMLPEALDILADRFPRYDWTYQQVEGRPGEDATEEAFAWLGPPDEDVMVCVHRGHGLSEHFHRHGYYFFNYAYQGDYQALSEDRYNLITIREGEMYIGQPFSGYALRGNEEREIVIVGVLVQKQAFYRDFLQVMMADEELTRFFLESRNDRFADSFRHLHGLPAQPVRSILEAMMCEYANEGDGSQKVLKPLALSLAEVCARQHALEHPGDDQGLEAQVRRYLNANLATASLGEAARLMGYHPNYLSQLVRKECGQTFSSLLSDMRMERADLLLRTTPLPVEEVAGLVGYPSTSNFYRAYRRAFGHSPRQA